MQVSVIGTGYVGLVTGVCLATIGHHVICVDNNKSKIKALQAGAPTIYEPGLEELMQEAMAAGRLLFTADLGCGVRHAEVIFIAVGTPPLPSGASDTRFVEAVARDIGRHLAQDRSYRVIVNKSTVPIGSGDWVRHLILEELQQLDNSIVPSFDVVSNPEFLREGSAVYDTFNPDRIVLGGSSPRAIQLMQSLYQPIISRRMSTPGEETPIPVVVTDLASAEMIKYAANSFLATKISFINEIANICERVGADITQVARGIGLDSRIGPKFLQAGLGWGGSCFPKDVSALIHTAHDYGYAATLLRASVSVNQQQRLLAIEKLQQELKILKGKTIGLLGLTFKPNTDDMRDTPAHDLIQHLHRLGARVKAYDPIISHQPQRVLESVFLATTVEECFQGCDAVILVTDWPEFQDLDFGKLAALPRSPLLIDGRNCLYPEALGAAGWTCISIGRPAVEASATSTLFVSAA
ncbi:MAG: UDP-glucose/GDP-mannose dehydrogenase family protein [Synechococcaceae cyanobacterium SM2_3_1]|nr:UDP-glucose/GDP-mannose dehydrogenase family protein [Synechococcaceae cyanobacterium SM2_3_1]